MFSLVIFLPLLMVSASSFEIVTNDSFPIISNSSWSATIQLDNSTQSTVIVPTAPPSFTSDITIDPTKPLDANPVYLVAVEAMYKFAQLPWNRALSGQTRITQAYSDVNITVRSTGAISRLETSHVILGLYRGILVMIERSWWYEALIGLKVHGTVVGYISILAPQQGRALNSTTAIPPAEVAAARSVEVPRPVRGRFFDPEDWSFQLEWTHLTEPDTLMAQQAIYTAVLSGLADAAFYDPATLISDGDVYAMTDAIGPYPLDYVCKFRIDIDPDDGYPGPLTYYLVTKTFRDVAGYIMPQAQWYGEYDIDLYYQQKLTAYVEVTKIDFD